MMNRTMKLLLLSDIFVLTGFGLIQPILAIYINDGGVTGGTMLTAGLASALFLFTKSLVQLPFGHYVDNQSGKAKWLLLGTLLMACVPIIYITAHSIYQIYLAEMVYGLGSGLAYPTWLGLWSANLDQGKRKLPVVDLPTSTGIGTAATGAAGRSSGHARWAFPPPSCWQGCSACWAAGFCWSWSAGVQGGLRIWGVRPVSVELGGAMPFPAWTFWQGVQRHWVNSGIEGLWGTCEVL